MYTTNLAYADVAANTEIDETLTSYLAYLKLPTDAVGLTLLLEMACDNTAPEFTKLYNLDVKFWRQGRLIMGNYLNKVSTFKVSTKWFNVNVDGQLYSDYKADVNKILNIGAVHYNEALIDNRAFDLALVKTNEAVKAAVEAAVEAIRLTQVADEKVRVEEATRVEEERKLAKKAINDRIEEEREFTKSMTTFLWFVVVIAAAVVASIYIEEIQTYIEATPMLTNIVESLKL